MQHAQYVLFSIKLIPVLNLEFMDNVTPPLHRGKIQELNTEILKMTREIDTYNQESATYLAFEKK